MDYSSKCLKTYNNDHTKNPASVPVKNLRPDRIVHRLLFAFVFKRPVFVKSIPIAYLLLWRKNVSLS